MSSLWCGCDVQHSAAHTCTMRGILSSSLDLLKDLPSTGFKTRRDVEKTTALMFNLGHTVQNILAAVSGSRLDDVAVLTCALAAHQVLALRLVGVDGRDRDIVLRVRVQVLQNMGGLVAPQDGLVSDGEPPQEQAGQHPQTTAGCKQTEPQKPPKP